MKRFFYAKIALTNLKKNRQTCFPYLLTCIATIMMFYIMSSLSTNSALNKMRGGATMKIVLIFGSVIVGIFAVLFLFYTNSFLVKRRKKEFGLYYILGMEKRHISRVMLWETIYTAILSLLFGIACGILFSKLVFLGLLKILKMEVVIGVEVSAFTLAETIGLFTVIFLLIFFNSVRLIYMVRPAELLKGGQIGEKMPKTKWPLAVLGIVTLAGGYILALKADNVMTGLNTFFVAVLLVIVGTFSLFTAGSIAFLKLLQKNKRYYYKTNHFISVSGMIYRMKQNAASLSLICIMSTGVLLLISSTTSLYVGQEHSLYLRYPKEFKLSLSLGEVPDDSKTFEKELKEIGTYAEDYLKDNKIATQNAAGQTVIEAAALQKDGNVQITSSRNGSSEDFSDLCMVQAITLEDYNREAKKDETLEDREALVFFEDSPIQQETFSINDMHWKVRQLSADSTMEDSGLKFYVTPVYRIVVKDFAQLQEIWKINKEAYGDHASQVKYEYSFDVDLSEEKIQKLEKSLNAYLGEQKNAPHAFFYGIETRTEGRAEFYSLYGGLFFLGIFLGLLFVMATVLIIYYKQISEGYEDKERFAILKKIGMERGEINASIRSQVLMVFFLPLAAAGIHSCFAFHLVKEILVGGFGLQDVGLLVICAVLTFLAFAVFYVIVYLITAREYYKIVSE